MSTLPTITLPDDHPRKEQLERKLEEYRGRLKPSESPESQMLTICQISILEKLLGNNEVITSDLSQELIKEYGELFNLTLFNNACNVIIDYCNTGGQNVWGGTGLN